MSWTKSNDVVAEQLDPYTSWAVVTGFRQLTVADDAPEALADPPIRIHSFLAELRSHFDRNALGAAVKKLGASCYPDVTRDASATAITVRVAEAKVDNFLADAKLFFRRVELASPVAAISDVSSDVCRNMCSYVNYEYSVSLDRKGLTPPVLLGVIDDACPFAHHSWHHRIRSFWEQGRSVGLRAPTAEGFSGSESEAGYGWEYQREVVRYPKSPLVDAIPWSTLPLSLTALRALPAYKIGGTVDEAAIYADGGFRQLNRRLSHGAHVLDLLTGEHPPSARFDATKNDDPQVREIKADKAGNCDIVFVQLPKSAIEDTSGRWLGAHVLDGLRYILSKAIKGQTVIANVSYGHSTGPHDGSSIIESAIDDLCAKNDGSGDTARLQVVLPSGNSFLSQSYAQLLVPSAKGEQRLIWRVLPDGHRPTFLELWFPDGTALSDVVIDVAPPRGGSVKIDRGGVFTGAACGATLVFQHYVGPGESKKTVALLAIRPTATTHTEAGHAVSPAGDWSITVQNNSSASPLRVDAYVARSTPHINARRTGTLSYLVSDTYDDEKYLRNKEDDEIDSIEAIKRRGSINGIATGNSTSKFVIAGHRASFLSTGKGSGRSHALYSSSGPDRMGNSLVSYSYPTDVNRALKGVLAAGNVGSTVSRLIGTSAAAPQFCRTLANSGGRWLPLRRSSIVKPPGPPPAPKLDERQLNGEGDIDPP